jgi:RNA polymerase sigma factor (sigma-70 family)
LPAERKKRERFSELYGAYYPMVYSAVYSRVENRDDVLDICHNVFAALYEKLDEVENCRKWLIGSLRIETLKYYEKKSRPDVNTAELFDDIGLSFVNGFRDARMVVSDAVESADLSEEDRLILEYIAYYNYSYSEVGKILGITKRQVGYRYNAIALKITESLRKRGINKLEDLL